MGESTKIYYSFSMSPALGQVSPKIQRKKEVGGLREGGSRWLIIVGMG